MKILFYYSITTFLLWPTYIHAAELTNPLQTTNIQEIVARLIQAILGITGSVALLMFIYGGFMWLISAGDKNRLTTGKETMKYAALGLVIIIGAYAIVSTIVTALESGVVG